MANKPHGVGFYVSMTYWLTLSFFINLEQISRLLEALISSPYSYVDFEDFWECCPFFCLLTNAASSDFAGRHACHSANEIAVSASSSQRLTFWISCQAAEGLWLWWFRGTLSLAETPRKNGAGRPLSLFEWLSGFRGREKSFQSLLYCSQNSPDWSQFANYANRMGSFVLWVFLTRHQFSMEVCKED